MNDGMNDAATVAARLAETRARITAAGGGPGVEILAVTKAFGPEVVDIAAAAGCAAIGENSSPNDPRSPIIRDSGCTSSANCRPTRCASSPGW